MHYARTDPEASLTKIYPNAKLIAIKEMNRYVQNHQQLNNSSFPSECPWTFDQVVEDDWLP